jgi:hypothetical protein
LELFFDLVFVFAFTRVTRLFLEDRPGVGWLVASWSLRCCGGPGVSYAWLTNTVDTNTGPVMATMLGDRRHVRGRDRSPRRVRSLPAHLGVAFLVVLVMHVALFVLAVRTEHDMLKAVLAGLARRAGTRARPSRTCSPYVALRPRVSGTLSRGRSLAAAAFAVLVPLVALVWLALHAYELVWRREERAPARLYRQCAHAS